MIISKNAFQCLGVVLPTKKAERWPWLFLIIVLRLSMDLGRYINNTNMSFSDLQVINSRKEHLFAFSTSCIFSTLWKRWIQWQIRRKQFIFGIFFINSDFVSGPFRHAGGGCVRTHRTPPAYTPGRVSQSFMKQLGSILTHAARYYHTMHTRCIHKSI